MTTREPKNGEGKRESRTAIPAIDILDRQNEILLLAEMPGVDEHGVELRLEQDTLSLDGRPQFSSYEGMKLAYCEHEPVLYHREFTLSEGIDRDRIEARVKNGILAVCLPKRRGEQSRKITVRGE